MPLKGPDDEDVRKLHNEINQVGNQRFILTTLSLTIFGVLMAWMVPRDGTEQLSAFPFIVSMVITLLLFSIYLWSHLLKNFMRTLTSYLAETGKSNWEADWKAFRESPHFAHTKPQTMIVMLLNLIGAGFPFLLARVYSLDLAPATWLIAGTVALFITTELLIYLMGFHDLFDREAAILKRWASLNRSRPP